MDTRASGFSDTNLEGEGMPDTKTNAPLLPSVLMLFNLNPDWPEPDRQDVLCLSERAAAGLRQLGHGVQLLPLRDANLVRLLRGWSPAEHLVFNWCEEIPGRLHSEAQAVHTIDNLEFVYTGSPRTALDLCEDKPCIKAHLARHGVPVPEWRVYTTDAVGDWSRFPAIVKPAHEHASIGIGPESVVTTAEALADRVRHVLKTYSQPAVVEDFIDGREFHVSLWGNDPVELLPIVEMDFSGFGDFHDRLCSYDSKHILESAACQTIQTRLPAPLTAAETAQLEAVCRDAFRVAGCRDYARMDVRLRDGVFYMLDVNPNPDLSAEASMACAAEYIGLSHADMLSRLIAMAAARHPRWNAELLRVEEPLRHGAPVTEWLVTAETPAAPRRRPSSPPARRPRLAAPRPTAPAKRKRLAV